MARSRPKPGLTPEETRALLTVGAKRAEERGDHDIAEAIRTILAPRGWEKLKPPSATGGNRNLGLWMDTAVKERIEQAAKDNGDNLAEIVNAGYRAFLAGEFEPAPLVRARRGSGTAKENLNVRPDNDLRVQVEKACPARSKELGYELSASKVAMAWLFSEYGEEAQLQQH